MQQVGKASLVLFAAISSVPTLARPTTPMTASAIEGDRPVLPASAITDSNTRQLGDFGTEADAQAAAREAGLTPGNFGLATIDGEPVAISARGRVYARDLRVGSGIGQREPKIRN